MATYNPPPGPAQRQIESIRAQTHGNWVCVISDDCSAPERFAAIQRDGRRRPALRALALAAPTRLLPQLRARAGAGRRRRRVRRAGRPGRLAGTRTSSRCCWSEIGDAQLVYSDARVVVARRRADLRDVVERSAGTTTRPAVAAGRQRGDRRRVAAPPRAAGRTRCRSRRPSSRISTTTGSACRRWRSARSSSSIGRCTTTSSTATRRSDTPRPTEMTSLARADPPPARAARARPDVASALLRRRLPAAAVRDRPADALSAPHERRKRRDATALPRTPTAHCSRSRRLACAGRARAGRHARDARRRVDAVSRARLAARCCSATARRRPHGRLRLDALPPPSLVHGARRNALRRRRRGDRRQDRAVALDGLRRRPAAGQSADPDDRPASTSSAATSRSSTWPSACSNAGCA